MFQIVVLYALFASTFSLGKVLLNFAPPIFLVGVRMSIAGLVLLAYQYINNKTTFKLRRSDWKLYLQVVLFTCYLPYILRFWGLQSMSPAKASLLYTLGPFITYLCSYLICNERVTSRKILGLVIGFIGLLPVLISPAPIEDLAGGIGFFSWPECYVILSISCLSYGWIIMRKLMNDHHYEPAMINGISMFTGGILALITSCIFESHIAVSSIAEFSGILAIVILVSNLLCHNMYGSLLKKYSPTLLSFAGFLTPLFASFYGWLFLGDTMGWTFYLSVIFVVIGLAIFYHDEFNNKGPQEVTPDTVKKKHLSLIET